MRLPRATETALMIGRAVEGVRSALDRHRFFRFLLAGVVNSLFGFSVFSAVVLLGGPLWLDLFIAVTAGIIFNFFSIGSFVFRRAAISRFPRFVVCYAVVYVTNLAMLEQLATSMHPMVAQAMLTLPIALLNYVLLRRFVFVPDSRGFTN